MKAYFKKLLNVLYFILNWFKYKRLNIRAVVFFSVRVEGKKFISLASRSVIQRQGWLLALKIDQFDPVLSIGEGTEVGAFCHIVSVREVIIEKNVAIANKVYIADNMHSYEDITTPIIFQNVEFVNSVCIGEGSWIGENASIVGASIGKNAVVGANSVVTKDVPDYTVVSGNPARIIRQYSIDKKMWI